MFKIALDDGHGMQTPGKRTPKFENGDFMHENEFNRDVVAKLDMILKRCGFETILTAPTDKDHTLSERVKTANNNKANIFISVHANAATGKWQNGKGIETYYFTRSSKSQNLAEIVHSNLIKGTKQVNRGVKTANFYVLRNTNMPAILIEAGFMDNREEAKLLLSDSFRQECAEEIAKGTCEYFGVEYVEDNIEMEQEHWAEEDWKYLNDNGIEIHEKRFDDSVTRGELFAALVEFHKAITKDGE